VFWEAYQGPDEMEGGDQVEVIRGQSLGKPEEDSWVLDVQGFSSVD